TPLLRHCSLQKRSFPSLLPPKMIVVLQYAHFAILNSSPTTVLFFIPHLAAMVGIGHGFAKTFFGVHSDVLDRAESASPIRTLMGTDSGPDRNHPSEWAMARCNLRVRRCGGRRVI